MIQHQLAMNYPDLLPAYNQVVDDPCNDMQGRENDTTQGVPFKVHHKKTCEGG